MERRHGTRDVAEADEKTVGSILLHVRQQIVDF